MNSKTTIMKNFLFLSILAMSLTCVAQVPADFNVAPPKYNKMVTCTADGGVNIRKAPSTTAPRALYNENKIEYFDVPIACYTYWSSGKTGGSICADKFSGTQPFVSESNGWYEIANIGPIDKNGNFTNGWVSAKFCTVKDITPITPALISEKELWLRSVGDGNLMIYYYADEMNGEYTFYVGRLVDGQLICPYAAITSVEETSSPSCIKKNAYNTLTFYCNSGEKDEEGPLFDKFKDSLFKSALANAEKLEHPVTVYYNGEWLEMY